MHEPGSEHTKFVPGVLELGFAAALTCQGFWSWRAELGQRLRAERGAGLGGTRRGGRAEGSVQGPEGLNSGAGTVQKADLAVGASGSLLQRAKKGEKEREEPRREEPSGEEPRGTTQRLLAINYLPCSLLKYLVLHPTPLSPPVCAPGGLEASSGVLRPFPSPAVKWAQRRGCPSSLLLHGFSTGGKAPSLYHN